jgi:lipoprotein-anchoring transpeptidase ErfK/SrfK
MTDASPQIVVKKKVEDMKELIGREYYAIKDVPNVICFTAVGHAIHGAYWHGNFGYVMSYGCVNLPLDAARWLPEWAPLGAPVIAVA